MHGYKASILFYWYKAISDSITLKYMIWNRIVLHGYKADYVCDIMKSDENILALWVMVGDNISVMYFIVLFSPTGWGKECFGILTL